MNMTTQLNFYIQPTFLQYNLLTFSITNDVNITFEC